MTGYYSSKPEVIDLWLFIARNLRTLLEEHNGSMVKDEAQRIVHMRYRQRHGWPAALDERDGLSHRTRWRSAWALATRGYTRAGVIKPCASTYRYELVVPENKER